MTERLTEKITVIEGGDIIGHRIKPYYEGQAAKKLSEYEDAEEEGRLVVLPCKVGDMVYEIYYILDYGEVGDKAEKHYDIREVPFKLAMLDDIGKTVFLTEKEAEEALKEWSR